MQRDDDLFRSILFEFEKQEDWLVIVPETLGMSADERRHLGHVQLLCDADLVMEVSDSVYRLTNSGHDYLSAIRSDTVWKKTKDGAAKVGGMSLAMMRDLALAYVKQEAAEKLGVKL
ncbi:hypothetical protein RA19_05085 [Leisingera sp. ANG-M1]|uniref:DUF2513 domain-containing protein n=1 Tax=Leisingera sp. ANG-M1 TaxID=1577895 RepID=UPI00057EE9ED|nr:DUF2513 domain-containing protein [Leisingera sp. ANG-M1]KIC11996.1 hypothetical protein RA19_05085 [Leisingera sp. ANG-M1]